jgi:uncharacterized phage-associated protein
MESNLEKGNNKMASVFDVAKFILNRSGPMSAMKLQKLVYYCQAWSLVWDGRPIFPEEIQAWIYGPVVPNLYQIHKGKYTISEEDVEGNPNNLTRSEKGTINAILRTYEKKPLNFLIELTHSEDPWRNARKGLSPEDRSGRAISLVSMAEYYATKVK